MSIREIAFEYVGWYCKRNDNDYRHSMERDEFFDNLVLELQGLLNEKGGRNFTWWDAHEVFNYIQNIINEMAEYGGVKQLRDKMYGGIERR